MPRKDNPVLNKATIISSISAPGSIKAEIKLIIVVTESKNLPRPLIISDVSSIVDVNPERIIVPFFDEFIP
jgi:hypothetical protein